MFVCPFLFRLYFVRLLLCHFYSSWFVTCLFACFYELNISTTDKKARSLCSVVNLLSVRFPSFCVIALGLCLSSCSLFASRSVRCSTVRGQGAEPRGGSLPRLLVPASGGEKHVANKTKRKKHTTMLSATKHPSCTSHAPHSNVMVHGFESSGTKSRGRMGPCMDRKDTWDSMEGRFLAVNLAD